MERFVKNFYYLIFPVLSIIFFFVLDNYFAVEPLWLEVVIAVVVAYLLSPRVKTVIKQNGKIKIIRWIFLKKAIFVRIPKNTAF